MDKNVQKLDLNELKKAREALNEELGISTPEPKTTSKKSEQTQDDVAETFGYEESNDNLSSNSFESFGFDDSDTPNQNFSAYDNFAPFEVNKGVKKVVAAKQSAPASDEKIKVDSLDELFENASSVEDLMKYDLDSIKIDEDEQKEEPQNEEIDEDEQEALALFDELNKMFEENELMEDEEEEIEEEEEEVLTEQEDTNVSNSSDEEIAGNSSSGKTESSHSSSFGESNSYMSDSASNGNSSFDVNGTHYKGDSNQGGTSVSSTTQAPAGQTSVPPAYQSPASSMPTPPAYTSPVSPMPAPPAYTSPVSPMPVPPAYQSPATSTPASGTPAPAPVQVVYQQPTNEAPAPSAYQVPASADSSQTSAQAPTTVIVVPVNVPTPASGEETQNSKPDQASKISTDSTNFYSGADNEVSRLSSEAVLGEGVKESKSETEDDSEVDDEENKMDQPLDEEENKEDEPYPQIEDFNFIDIIKSKSFMESDKLTCIYGVDESKNVICQNFKDFYNTAIFCENDEDIFKLFSSIIVSLTLKNVNFDMKFVICDSDNGSKFDVYNDLSYMFFNKTAKSHNEIIDTLYELTKEIDKRYENLAKVSAQNIESFNDMMQEANIPPMPYVMLFFNNYFRAVHLDDTDMINTYLNYILKFGRLVGVYSNIVLLNEDVEEKINYNLQTRISFKTEEKQTSFARVGKSGAERISSDGEYICKTLFSDDVIHLKVPNITEREVGLLIKNIDK